MKALLAIVFTLVLFVPAQAEEDWFLKESPYSVAETVSRFKAAVEGAGATVFNSIDHAAGAEGVGLDLPPTTVVIFGNPNVGTPVMQASRRAAIDFPQKVLVWEEDGQTMIGAIHPHALRNRYAVTGAEKSFETMIRAINAFMDAAVSE